MDFNVLILEREKGITGREKDVGLAMFGIGKQEYAFRRCFRAHIVSLENLERLILLRGLREMASGQVAKFAKSWRPSRVLASMMSMINALNGMTPAPQMSGNLIFGQRANEAAPGQGY